MPDSSEQSDAAKSEHDDESVAQDEGRQSEVTETAGTGAPREPDDPGYEAEYVHLPGGLHRITTRRITHRHEVTEDIEETIREVIPTPYQGPVSDHPAPVG